VSDNRPTEILTARTARAALSAACSIAGIDTFEATLLGPVADNAVFRLPGKLVARVTLRSAAPRARREVLAGRWLADQGVQAVRPVETLEQPLLVDGHVVTLWYEVTDGVMASTAEFGKLLRQLHELSPPSDFKLWPLEPFVRLDEHLTDAAEQLPVDEADFLLDRLAELRTKYELIEADLPITVIHGDANPRRGPRDWADRLPQLHADRSHLDCLQMDRSRDQRLPPVRCRAGSLRPAGRRLPH
jgi:hypothetical protein